MTAMFCWKNPLGSDPTFAPNIVVLGELWNPSETQFLRPMALAREAGWWP